MSMYDVLTTGQMIDKLERGEIGECVQGDNKGAKVYYSKAPGAHDKLLVEHSLTHIQEVFNICDYHKKSCWIIKPNYVSFGEALQAYKKGKTITCRYGKDFDGEPFVEDYNKAFEKDISFEMIIDGKWTIEGWLNE